MQHIEERLIHIETVLSEHERTLEELNDVIITQGKLIDRLTKQNRYLIDLLKNDAVKPQSEETPPPHY